MKLDPPDSLDELCADLNIGLKRRAKLSAEHGDDLIPHLQKLWRWHKRQDAPRLLHRNPGAGRADYTDNPALAMNEEPEAVPPAEIEHYRDSAQAHLRYREEKEAEVANLKAAMMTLKLTIDALPRDTRRKMGRSFWTLRSSLKVAERDIKRRAA